MAPAQLEEYPTDEIPDQAVADHSGASDLQETLRRAVDRLPQRMRAAVVLRYYEDMTEAEVADVLGVSLGTVKSTVSRAVAKLRIDTEPACRGMAGMPPSAESDVFPLRLTLSTPGTRSGDCCDFGRRRGRAPGGGPCGAR